MTRKRIVAAPDVKNNGAAIFANCTANAQQPVKVASEEPAAVDTPAGEIRPDPGPDPFDPQSLRLTQDFAAGLGVKKVLLTVPVRKPEKSWFIRVHPQENYRLQTGVIETKEDREPFLVDRPLWPELAAETTFSFRTLYTAINRQGDLFLWPVRLSGSGGREDAWIRSACEAANLATKSWVRVVANMGLGGYEVFRALGRLSEPEWPDLPFPALLRLAFKDRFIRDVNHPVLRRLRGEV
jgi:hypothetical protein